MILGIGTDIVNPTRFVRWQHYSAERVLRVFTLQELEVSTASGKFVPEKLAVRFAAKEAFYKAFSAMLVGLEKTHKTASLLAVCKAVEVVASDWGPQLLINWEYLQELFGCILPKVYVHCSLAHEREMVVAFVIIDGAYGS